VFADEILKLDLFSAEAEPGRECAFLVLLAFLCSFLFIRTSARLIRDPNITWWPGNVETGGVHIHHLVWGISLLLMSGFAAFVSDLYAPWWQITAILFGVGAGLTLDEFALWLHLEDVYWTEEGRQSIDAVVVAALIAGLVVLGIQPFDIGETAGIASTAAAVLVVLGIAAIAFAKGRILLGIISIFMPLAGVWAAIRLAKPHSAWASRRYVGRHAHKFDRASRRFPADRRSEVIGDRLKDAIGGTPSVEEADQSTSVQR
jgi:hypothetical protein